MYLLNFIFGIKLIIKIIIDNWAAIITSDEIPTKKDFIYRKMGSLKYSIYE